MSALEQIYPKSPKHVRLDTQTPTHIHASHIYKDHSIYSLNESILSLYSAGLKMNLKYNLRWSKKKKNTHYTVPLFTFQKWSQTAEAVSEKVSASVGIKRVSYSQVLLIRSIWLTGHHQVWTRIKAEMLPVGWSRGFEEIHQPSLRRNSCCGI